MKNTFLALVLIFASQFAFAETKFGSECGLTDTKDDTWQDGKSYNLNRATKSQIEKLPTLIKQQIIITAKEAAKSNDDGEKIVNTQAAVDYLRRADGPVVTHYIVRGTKITEVLAYPGDNPVGNIFAYGTTHIIAENGDDDIICRQ